MFLSRLRCHKEPGHFYKYIVKTVVLQEIFEKKIPMLYNLIMTKLEIASYIDHTLLAQNATAKQISQLCQGALRYHFASVCVNPVNVRRAAAELEGSSVKVCTVIGFPLGASTPETKAFEAADAIRNGASEVDMVIFRSKGGYHCGYRSFPESGCGNRAEGYCKGNS